MTGSPMFVNPEHLIVPSTPTGDPPDDSGLWMELIADSFGPEGPRQLWTRPNPLYPSSLPPSDSLLPQRLSFDLSPPLDLQAARDRELLVAEDAWNSGALLVIPVAVARIDAAYITCILESRTVGELRRNPRAWRVAAERYDDSREDDSDPLSAFLGDDVAYDPYAWFGDEGIVYAMPLGRLRTAQCAPTVLDSLAREDRAIGMDYEPAPWWPVEDKSAVIEKLEKYDYLVRRDDALVARYSNY